MDMYAWRATQTRRSSSTDRTSEPFCSRWLRCCARSLSSSSRSIRGGGTFRPHDALGHDHQGGTIEEIARERRCDPLDAVCDVIIADKGATRILVRSMSEADVRAIAADPSALVGSDGPCVAPYDVTGQGKPHPRLYGTFPRLIGHYARDLGLLTLPQAIAKMTGGAAAALGLADRDLLTPALCRAGCSGDGEWCWREAGPTDWHRRAQA